MRLLPAVAAILLVAAGCTASSRAAKSQPAAGTPAATPAASDAAQAPEAKPAADAAATDEAKAAEAKAAEDKKAAEAKAAEEKKAAEAAKAEEERKLAAEAKAAEQQKLADAKAAKEKAAAEAKAAADAKAAEVAAAKARTAEEKARAAEEKKAADAARAAEVAAAKAKAAEEKKAADAKAAEARAARTAPAAAASWAMKSGGDKGGQFSELTVEGATLRLRYIPPGTYTQGSEPGDSPWRLDDEMAHPVTFTKGFWLAETETTQALYQAVMGTNPSQFQDPAKPVDSVSWYDAQSFVNRLNGLFNGLNARLPSEAEWEYACRAGSTGPFADGSGRPAGKGTEGPAAVGWTLEVSGGMTHPVGTLAGNAWGLKDMHGNLMEWCQDAYANYPASANDPKLVDRFGARVVRGGSWRHPEWTARSAARRAIDSGVADNSLGFRILVPAK